MESYSDDFKPIFIKTTNFIYNLKSKPITLTQNDNDFVYQKINNLAIWLSGKCDLIHIDFVEEIETIMNKIYDSETTAEYTDCINSICNQINLENLTDVMPINLIEDDIKLNNSSVTIEELIGGQNKNNPNFNLLYILFFGIFEIYLIYVLYMIFSGQATPSIGDTVYTVGGKYSSPKPYVIESQIQIYNYLGIRIFICIFYSYFCMESIQHELENKFGKLSFVKLLNLTFDEQNQVIKYITYQIDMMYNTKQIEPVNSTPVTIIKIPELKNIKPPKTKLSIQNPDIFMKTNKMEITTQTTKITNSDLNNIKKIQEYNQHKLNEINEQNEKKNIFKMMRKCIPSIFKKIKNKLQKKK